MSNEHPGGKKSREAAWINHNKEKAAVKKETLLSGLMD